MHLMSASSSANKRLRVSFLYTIKAALYLGKVPGQCPAEYVSEDKFAFFVSRRCKIVPDKQKAPGQKANNPYYLQVNYRIFACRSILQNLSRALASIRDNMLYIFSSHAFNTEPPVPWLISAASIPGFGKNDFKSEVRRLIPE